MSRRFLLINVILVAVSALIVVDLVRELSASRRLPSAPVPRIVQPGPAAPGASAAAPAAADRRDQWNVIATKSLFTPSRPEPTAASAVAAAPPPPKLYLHGVVLDEGRSRAFLEDASTKKVFGYAIGDQIGGGRVDAISADRV